VIVQADRGYDIGVAFQLLPGPPAIADSLPSSTSTNPSGSPIPVSSPRADGETETGETTTQSPPNSGHNKTIRKILSIITPDDKYMNYMLRNKAISERQALVMAKTICSELKVGPSVEIVSVEFQADRKKLTVYYKKYADVSLCKLIRKLHTAFKMRIWMENIEPMVAAQENPEIGLPQLFQKLEERYFDLACIDIQVDESSDHENVGLDPASAAPAATPSPVSFAHQPHGATVTQSPGPRHSSNSHPPVGLPFLPRSGLAPPPPQTHNGPTMSHHTHLDEVSGVLSSQASDMYYQSQRHLNPRRRNQLPQRPPVPSGYADYLPRPPSASMYGSYPIQRSVSLPQSQYQFQSPSQAASPRTLLHSGQYYRSTGGASSAFGTDQQRDPYLYEHREYFDHSHHQQQPRPFEARSVERGGYGTDDAEYLEVNGGMDHFVSPHSKVISSSQSQYHQGISSRDQALQPPFHRRSGPSGVSFQYGDAVRSSSPSTTTATSSPYDQMMSLSAGFGAPAVLSENAGSQRQSDTYGDQYLNFDRNSRFGRLPAERAPSGFTGYRSPPHAFFADEGRGELSSQAENTGTYKSQLSNYSSGLQLRPDFDGTDSLFDDMVNFNSLHLR
jgi:hypothetical protein